jgi:hypothetical protein
MAGSPMSDDLAHSVCRRCRRRIVTINGRRWFHIDPQGSPSRGCYAASFDEEHPYPDGSHWDQSLKRKWTADPPLAENHEADPGSKS